MQWLKQRVHASWFIAAGCIGVLVGVALSRAVGPVGVVFLATGSFALVLGMWRRELWMGALVVTGGCMVGMWRGGLAVEALNVYPQLIGKSLTISGRVSADPQPARGGVAVALNGIHTVGHDIAGMIYAVLPNEVSVRREDTITVRGVLAPGYGTYAASMYTAALQQVVRPKNIFLDMRDTFTAAVRRAIPEPMASLGIGFLVGQKSELPTDFSEALKIAGLTHIVVASGYNLTILVRVARRLFAKISKYQAALWSVAMILGFMAITGWSASMTRAGLVAGLSLWAWYYGRAFHPVTLLALAACVTAMVYPPYAWGDIGWLLSFAAFAGVIILAPLLQAYFYGAQVASGMARILLETLSAQLATLPIMLSAFGQFSVIALLSNIMVLSLVPIAMALTAITGISQLLTPVIAPLIAWPAHILLSYMVWAVNWTASFKWAQITWLVPWWGALICYILLVGVVLYLRRITGYQLQQVNVVE